MPKHIGRSNRTDLIQRGPLLQVQIRASLGPDQGDGPVVDGMALIDTGSYITGVSQRVVTESQGFMVDQIQSDAVGGLFLHGRYCMHLHLVESGIVITDMLVASMDLASKGFDVLIGRDVLSIARFVYDGLAGQWEIQIPPDE